MIWKPADQQPLVGVGPGWNLFPESRPYRMAHNAWLACWLNLGSILGLDVGPDVGLDLNLF